MQKSSNLIRALVMAAALFASATASSQALAPLPPPAILAPPDYAAATDIDGANLGLQGTIVRLRAHQLSDRDLRAEIATLPPIRAKLAAALATLTPHLQDADLRLAQLGPAPAAGQPPEDPETAATRRALTSGRAAIDTEVKEAKLLTVEASQVDRTLSDRLRRNFSTRLWTRERSVLNPGLWADAATAAPGDIAQLLTHTEAEARLFARVMTKPQAWPAALFAAAVAFLLLGPARILLNKFAERHAGDKTAPTPFRRAGLAVALVLVAAVTPLAAGEVLRSALIDVGGLTNVFASTSGLFIRVVVFAMALEGLGRALLAPSRPAWRLAPMSDRLSARLASFPVLIGAASGISTLATGIGAALDMSVASTVATDYLAMLLELAAIGGALAVTSQARAARLAQADVTAPPASRPPWVLAALGVWITLIVSLGAMLFGYRVLAGFLLRETVWIGSVLAALFLLLNFVDEFFPAVMSPRGLVGRTIQTGLGLSSSTMEQIGVLLAGVARLLLLLAGWTAILLPFGASAGDLATRVTGSGVVIRFGQVSISPTAVAGAVALFLLGLVATRAVRRWVEGRYLPKTSLDAGLRTSVGAAVTYGGGAIAVLIAFAYLGLSFSQVALLASALSVGIGFGLQAIIGNFVSGLILLAERPVQVGDWIAIGDLEGDVRRINIRATEIEMMDKSKLIVPNSDLVSKTVRNVTHGGASGRVRIILRVDDSSDPALVREALLETITAHEGVLKDPPPAVYISDVKDGALEFTVFAYVASPRLVFRIKSELLFKIVPSLKARSIGLANSTPVVNVGMPDRPIEPAA